MLDPGLTIQIFLLVLVFLVVISIVISTHEASHAFVANYLGDPTARLSGRMSLNPIVHIDPLGTLVLPLLLLLLSGFVFGWAKPTPVNPINLRNPRRDSALVAFAGPLSNFLLAFIFGTLSRFLPLLTEEKTSIFNMVIRFNWEAIFTVFNSGFVPAAFIILSILIILNLILGIFNLIPIPPLDGYKVLIGILPRNLAIRLTALEAIGPFFLLIFILFFFSFLSPVIFGILQLLLVLFTGQGF